MIAKQSNLKSSFACAHAAPDRPEEIFTIQVEGLRVVNMASIMQIVLGAPSLSATEVKDGLTRFKRDNAILEYERTFVQHLWKDWISFRDAKKIMLLSGLPEHKLKELWNFENNDNYREPAHNEAICSECRCPVFLSRRVIGTHGQRTGC